jgi:hypothetical protein
VPLAGNAPRKKSSGGKHSDTPCVRHEPCQGCRDQRFPLGEPIRAGEGVVIADLDFALI